MGEEVRLERDVQPRDRYERTLAYVWLPDGRMANEEMVDPLWVLNWSEGGEIPDIDPNRPRGKGRPAARKSYKTGDGG